MSLLAHDSPINEGELLLYLQRLRDVRHSLKNHWIMRSQEPLLRSLDLVRDSILKDVEISEGIIEALLSPPSHHECDRPEDCDHPACRAKVDQWSLANHGFIAADHPKANPMPSERELAQAWDA